MAKVMLVDDEPEFTFIIRKILEKEGFEAVEAHNGREALELVKVEKPDLILLDIMMPEMDGWEVAKTIKADENLKHIPIMMLTIKFQQDFKLKSFQHAQCDGYITKPVNKEKLLKAVRWVLGEPHFDAGSVPSKCGIDCRVCDQFVYEICKGCLVDRKDTCIVNECTIKQVVNSCLECVKVSYCKKRKEAIDNCLVFNPAKEEKKNFIHLLGEEENVDGINEFTRAVFDGSKGISFAASKENSQINVEGVDVHEIHDLKEVENRIKQFVKANPNSVVFIESLLEVVEKRPFPEILKFIDKLHGISIEKSAGIIVFVGDLRRDQRMQIFNYLASVQIEAIVKAISNPQRKDILEILKMAGKSTFTDMLQGLGYSNPSKLSFHLKILKQVGIIDQDHNGIYYLTDTGRKLDELLFKMKDTVSTVLSITPDFKVVAPPNPVARSKIESFKRYIKLAEKGGRSRVTGVFDELSESLGVFYGEEEATRIIITVFDEFISTEKMLEDEDLKKKISEIAFVFLADVMPLEDAIDWAEKILIKHSLKPAEILASS
ncbi:polar-differentiation response regulator DivK [archaeon BMS3Abin16]|nr:polar-differentiation response regulator DivK [archaeon BMS3Abin16]